MLHTRQSIGGLGNLMFKQAYIIGQMLDGNIPDVYLQSEKYWLKHKQAIKEFYSHGIPVQSDKVAIHIRRGDYLKASHFHVNLLETDYYQKAVKMFPNKQFIVFCKDNQNPQTDYDDREWCKQFMKELVGDRFEMSPEGYSETDDMNLMASCSGIIMANSSFSWWAAYLNPYSPMIICPEKWFVDGIQRIDLLDSWVKI